ncbi:MAG: S41 family peptidase [Rhodospirillales bacterium]
MFSRYTLCLLFCLCLTVGLGRATSAQEQGYYAWPTLQGPNLVFASEGDLWLASSDGGRAQRLTSHPEEETRPAISPDGQWLAFNAHYDGGEEVYVMPLAGGVPRQLTFEGGGTAVLGWTPDGRVLFASSDSPGPQPRILRSVDKDGGALVDLPLLQASDATFSGDGRQLFFTRFGLAGSRDHARLYRGGRMAQLWRYDLEEGAEAERLAADFGAPLRHPAWWQGRVYFVSDKNGWDNIWSLGETGSDPRRHSDFTDWRLLNPSLAEGELVYQRGADLYAFDLAAKRERKIELSLVSDRDGRRLRWLDEPLAYLETARMGAQGGAVAVTARGQVALAFPGERRRVALSLPVGARARAAVPGAEGDWIYLILDRGLASAIWRYPRDGRGQPEQLTQAWDARIWSFALDPKGDSLVFDDKNGALWRLDLRTSGAAPLRIDSADDGQERPFHGFAWSLDGGLLAYGKQDARWMSRLVLQDLEGQERHVLTGGKYQSYAPAFSRDGAWLYFVSERTFEAWPRSPWGDRNMGPTFDRRGKLYALQLDPEAAFPFAPGDELSDEDTADGDSAPVAFEGLAERLWVLPVEAGNYWALSASADYLYVRDWNGQGADLLSIAIDPLNPDVSLFADDVESYALSADGETLFLQQGEGTDAAFYLVPAGAEAPQDLSNDRLRLGDWRLWVDPPAEWRQMFVDAWRLHRDFAYDPGLRGLDWTRILAKYEPLVARIADRSELDDILAQMVAELGILHSQIREGDEPQDDESGALAFLGAEVAVRSEGLEILRIYDGERALPEQLGPLLQPGVDVREGDLLTALDGRPLRSRADLAAALQHKAGQEVRLDLLRADQALSAIVTPVERRAAARLRYRDWVEGKRERVAEDSEGRIGYLHLPAMRGRDMANFARDFHEHLDKEGLILDVRGNWGGNIDSWIIATLLRRVWSFWRIGGATYGNMQNSFRGHLAVLIDEGTYSDGETFAAGVKALDLAPLIGSRSAGAGIWLTDRNRLSDRGMARIAEWPQFDLEGRWIIEGAGVSPDIAVVNPPRASYAGEDAQLDAALQYLDEKIREAPIAPLVPQPLPPLGINGVDLD